MEKVILSVHIYSGLGDFYANICSMYNAGLMLLDYGVDVTLHFNTTYSSNYHSKPFLVSDFVKLDDLKIKYEQNKPELLSDLYLLDDVHVNTERRFSCYSNTNSPSFSGINFPIFGSILKHWDRKDFRPPDLSEEVKEVAYKWIDLKNINHLVGIQWRVYDHFLTSEEGMHELKKRKDEIINYNFKVKEKYSNSKIFLGSISEYVRGVSKEHFPEFIIPTFSNPNLKYYYCNTGYEAHDTLMSHMREIFAEMYIFSYCSKIFNPGSGWTSNFLFYSNCHDKTQVEWHEKFRHR